MNWMIPDIEPYLVYTIKEINRWMGANVSGILIITNVLTVLKVYAVKSKNIVDDKIISLLQYIFSFRWLNLATKEKEPPDAE